MTTSISVTDKNSKADAHARNLDSGKLKIYSGAIPADADATNLGTLLVTLSFSATSGPGSSGGVFTASAITSGVAVQTGVATFYRATKSDDTVIEQGTAGTSGTDLILDTTSIASGITVSASSYTHTQS